MKVNVLGTDYTILFKTRDEDILLQDYDGYCDKTTKSIVVLDMKRTDSSLKNPMWYQNKILCHEIVHAFLYESGLQESVDWNEELLVDWVACQGEKIFDAWKEVRCLISES